MWASHSEKKVFVALIFFFRNCVAILIFAIPIYLNDPEGTIVEIRTSDCPSACTKKEFS